MATPVDIVSIEMIKPSYPTPLHLRNLNLSFLDQYAPSAHFHIILYYEANQLNGDGSHNYEETSLKLKRSLSKALVTYYPLAGRIRDTSWVDCNDAGAEYLEARFADIQLLDVIEKCEPAERLNKYVSVVPHGGVDIPLSIRVNLFGCGGIAIGLCISHKVTDATSMVTFLNVWAATCRNDTTSKPFIKPSFGSMISRFPPMDCPISHNVTGATSMVTLLNAWAATCRNDTTSKPFIKPSFGSMISRFPPMDCPLIPPPLPGAMPENIVTKRYVFDEPKLLTIKNLIAKGKGPYKEINPTRVEAVTAFIWKNFIDAVIIRDKNKAKNIIFAAAHAMDIRSRASPPFPQNYFGNACSQAVAMEKKTDSRKEEGGLEHTYHDLAVKMRDAIRKVDVDYMKRMEDGDSFLKYLSTSEMNDPCFHDGRMKLETCCFSSWSRLPLYDADYGWGKPVWISPIAIPVKNLIVLFGTKSGNGIEAWVNMPKEDIAFIDTNYQLISSLTP